MTLVVRRGLVSPLRCSRGLSTSGALVVVLSACSSPAPGGPNPSTLPVLDDAGGQVVDSGTENGPTDASAPRDAAIPDATSPDAARPDAASMDAAGREAGLTDASSTDAPSPPLPTAFVTTDDLSLGLSPVTVSLGSSEDAGAVISVDPTTSFQSMLGFGASITDSSSFVLTQHLTASALTATLTRMFDPVEGIGLNFLRQPMGASDFSSAGNFSYDDGASDPTLQNFNIAQDLKATVPVLKQVLAINPGLFVLGTPWSPPAWMKLNASMDGTGTTGGNSGLAGADYAPLGAYFVRFIQAYAAQGVTVNAITPQNEPLNGSSTYPGMDLTAPYELQLIADDLGPAFADAGVATRIWAYDHNWDNETYAAEIAGDTTAGPFTEGAAFHCYAGDASAMTTFHNAYPDKSVYMTECSGGTWQSDPFANTIDMAIDSTSNWARAISLWNVALDETGGPTNNGCSDCRGIVTVNSHSDSVTYNADFFALGHFSKFVRRGAVRIASISSNAAIHQVAFRNIDGSFAVIAHNVATTAVTVQVGAGASAIRVSVPANAAVTVTWTSP